MCFLIMLTMFVRKDVHKKKVLTLICFPNELVVLN